MTLFIAMLWFFAASGWAYWWYQRIRRRLEARKFERITSGLKARIDDMDGKIITAKRELWIKEKELAELRREKRRLQANSQKIGE